MPFRRPPFGRCVEPTPLKNEFVLLTDEGRQTYEEYKLTFAHTLPFRIKIERRFYELAGTRNGQTVYAPTQETRL